MIIKRDLNRTDRNETKVTWSWRYCLRPRGRFHTLFQDSSAYGGYGDIVTYTDPVLSGRYAATTDIDEAGGGRYGCLRGTNILRLTTARAVASGRGPAVTCAVSISGLVVNTRGFAAWRQRSPLPATFTPINGVSCPSVSLCIAVDGGGNVLSSSDPTGGRAAWSLNQVVSGPISAVSCPTAAFCAAVSSLMVLTSTDPVGGASAWHAATVDDRALTSISCASESLCIATDNSGDLLASTDPTGGAGAWTKVDVDNGTWITSVSCPSTALCVATDYGGNVITSTNPTGGAQAWSIAKVDTEPGAAALVGVNCPSASLCIAPGQDYTGGNLAISTNPAGGASAWTLTHVDGNLELTAAACATNSLCVVFDGAGHVLTSTNPAGGPAAWTTTPGPTPGPGWPVRSASCPSVSLCIAAGGGSILSSTNPTGGSAAWSAAPVDVPDCALTTPCIAEQLYAYTPHAGAQIFDSAPPGTGQVISDPTLNGNTVTWTDAGVAKQLTLH